MTATANMVDSVLVPEATAALVRSSGAAPIVSSSLMYRLRGRLR